MAVQLGEEKSQFQTSAALRPHPLMGMASGVNPEEKFRVKSEDIYDEDPSGRFGGASA